MAIYQRLLLASDFSDNKHLPLERAKILQQNFAAKLYLVHVIEPIPAYGYYPDEPLKSSLIDNAKNQLNKLATYLDLPSEQVYLKFGSVKKQVLTLSEELNVDLIIIGSHGRHGLSRLLGSSAQSIVHHARCDVLTVRCR